MKTSIRAAGIKSIGNNKGGLGASELHGKRLDDVSQKRIISAANSINWSKAGEGTGLDLVEAFKTHKKEFRAVERGKSEIGTHLLVVVPPEWIREGGDIYDQNNPNTLKAIDEAVKWAESWQGKGSVFAYRFDLDEKGTGVVDLFTAPVFEQGRRNSKKVQTISPNMAKEEIVKQTGEKTSGAAFQTSWAEWAKNNLDNRMERGNRKEKTGRDHVHAEVYAKEAEKAKAEVKKQIEIKVQEQTKEFEVKQIEENDRLKRLREEKQRQLDELYRIKQQQLEENYELRKKQIDALYEIKEAELAEITEKHAEIEANKKELEQQCDELEQEIADKSGLIASLDKREAAVIANEAKKLKLFNKSEVIQDKLKELVNLKGIYDQKYRDVIAQSERDYVEKERKLNNSYVLKSEALDKRIKSHEANEKEAKELISQGHDIRKLLRENNDFKDQVKTITRENNYEMDKVNNDLTRAKAKVDEQAKIIKSQEVEIKKLTLTKKMFDFIVNILKQTFPDIYAKIEQAWKKSPENPNQVNENRYDGPSM